MDFKTLQGGMVIVTDVDLLDELFPDGWESRIVLYEDEGEFSKAE